MTKQLFFLTILFLFPIAVFAEESDQYIASIDGNTLSTSGMTFSDSGAHFSILPGAANQDMTIRFRNIGQFGSDQDVPALPNRYRSKQSVYSYNFNYIPSDDAYVTIEYGYKKKPKRLRRLFYLEPDSTEWKRVRTVVDHENKTVRAQIPATRGHLVVGVHKYKKERPIKNTNFSAYGGIPYSDTAAVIDVESGKFLYKEEAKKQRSIASLSKIATALVFLESDPNMDELVEYEDRNNRIGAKVDVQDGDLLSLKQVLMGTLIPSANNMAMTLSESTDRSSAAFVIQMNQRMNELGLKKTFFREPTGLDSNNVSSAGNIAKLARYAFTTYPGRFQEAANSSPYHFVTANTGRDVTMHSTNKFDGRGKYDVVAFKTGYLPGTADRTLAVQLRRRSDSAEIIVVLLGNPQYNTIFDEAYGIADWAFNNWTFHNY